MVRGGGYGGDERLDRVEDLVRVAGHEGSDPSSSRSVAPGTRSAMSAASSGRHSTSPVRFTTSVGAATVGSRARTSTSAFMSMSARTVVGVAAARVPGPPLLHRPVPGRAAHQQVRLPVPGGHQLLGVGDPRVRVPAPRMVGRPDPSGVCAVQHQRRDPLGVRGRQQQRHRTALGVADDDRLLGPRRVHHGEHVAHPGLQVRHALRSVGHAGAALVEADQPAHRAQAVEEPGVPRVVPVQVEV